MTFSLFDLVLLIAIGLVMFQFWRIRAISEAARQYLEHYCEKNQLQLISVGDARFFKDEHQVPLAPYLGTYSTKCGKQVALSQRLSYQRG